MSQSQLLSGNTHTYNRTAKSATAPILPSYNEQDALRKLMTQPTIKVNYKDLLQVVDLVRKVFFNFKPFFGRWLCVILFVRMFSW